MTTQTRNIGLAAVLIIALVAGVFWGLGSDDSSSFENVDASSANTSTTTPPDTPDDTGDDGSGPSGGTNTAGSAGGSEGVSTDDGSASPAGATTPAIGPVTLSSSLECATTVVPEVFLTVDGGDTLSTGTLPQQTLDAGSPIVVLGGQSRSGNAGTDHTVDLALREHMEGAFLNRTETTPGAKSVVVPASSTHPEWTWTYTLTFGDGEVTVSDVVLSVSGCNEVIVPQLMVSVVNGNGTVTTFLDTGSTDNTHTLVSGQPLVISEGAESGIDPADINRVEVRLFEHNFAREVDVSAEDNGSFSVEVPKNGSTGGEWTLSFDVDGLV